MHVAWLGAGAATQIAERAPRPPADRRVGAQVRDRVAIAVPIIAERVDLRDQIAGHEADVETPASGGARCGWWARSIVGGGAMCMRWAEKIGRQRWQVHEVG